MKKKNYKIPLVWTCVISDQDQTLLAGSPEGPGPAAFNNSGNDETKGTDPITDNSGTIIGIGEGGWHGAF